MSEMHLKAITVKDLADSLAEAIKVVGEDAKWWGWDDGSVILESKDRTTTVFIESAHYD
jgi:hypothetical protein